MRLKVIFLSYLILLTNLVSAQNENVHAKLQELKNQNVKLPNALFRDISLHIEGASVESALAMITDQTGIDICYANDLLPKNNNISLNLKNVTALEALLTLLVKTGTELQVLKDGSLVIKSGEINDSPSNIKGKVTNAVTGEPLPGANVVILGTSLGAATTLSGEYSIPNVPPGSYTLKFSYIGFKEKKYEIIVQPDKTITHDEAMDVVAIVGEELIVTAQAQGQLEAINQQLSSETIKNVVSAERIQEFPDENAASAVGRLPGVSVDGSSIVIRGIEAKMNKVLVNNISLPSTDFNNRSTSLDIISQKMLAGIEVIKALTPDMDADAVGGVVNLKLKEAPKNLHFDLLTQGEYDGLVESYNNYRFWGSISNRFFNDKVGLYLQLSAAKLINGGHSLTGGYEIRDDDIAQIPVDQKHYSLNSLTLVDSKQFSNNYNGSLALDYKLSGLKLYLYNMYNADQVENIEYRDGISLVSQLGKTYTLNHNKRFNEILANTLQAELELDKIKFDYNLSHVYAQRDVDYDYRMTFVSLTNLFTIPEMGPSELLGKEPSYLYPYINQDIWTQAQPSRPNIYDQEYNERRWTHALNAEIPVSFTSWFSAKIKTGLKYNTLKRESNPMVYGSTIPYESTPGGLNKYAMDVLGPLGLQKPEDYVRLSMVVDKDYEPINYLNDEYKIYHVMDVDVLDRWMEALRPHLVPLIFADANAFRDDYTGNEKLTAGYLMSQFNFGSSLSVLTGVRYEHMLSEYSGYGLILKGENVFTKTDSTAKRTNEFWLPSFHVRYQINDWSNIRFAWTNSLTRPDYLTMVPNYYLALVGGGSIDAGNPDIKPAQSNNLDISYSVFSNKVGLASVGFFYKKITDLFYRTRILVDTNSVRPEFYYMVKKLHASATEVSTYINSSNPAELTGFEIEWQTNFWYLPKPFNSLVLNINYTKTWSKTRYPLFYKLPVYDTTGFIPKIIGYTTLDSSRSGRLLQQSNDLANIALGYDYKGLSARLIFKFTGDILASVGRYPTDDHHTENRYSWDLNIQQELPIEGMKVFFNAVNVTGASVQRYRLFNPDLGKEYLSAYYQREPSYSVGLRYSF